MVASYLIHELSVCPFVCPSGKHFNGRFLHDQVVGSKTLQSGEQIHLLRRGWEFVVFRLFSGICGFSPFLF
jgi:hypothetical protein